MKVSRRPRETRLRALIDVSQAISASLAHEDILAQICSQAASLLHAESSIMTEICTACEYPENPCLKVVATSADARLGLGERLSMAGSLNGRAVTERRTIIVNDVLADSRAAHALAS